MRLILCMMALFLLLASPVTAAEENFDGSKTLLCASVEALDCVPGEECVKGLPDVLGAPQFLKIDFAGQEIVGPKRTTPVLHMEKSEEQILLQGVELKMGWIFALDRITGKFSATLTDRGGAFVIFGACTPK
jgi:hypothetical protein